MAGSASPVLWYKDVWHWIAIILVGFILACIAALLPWGWAASEFAAGWAQAISSVMAIAVGALAVRWQVVVQHREQDLRTRKADLSAGNLALMTIGSQYSSILRYRRELRQQLDLRYNGMPSGTQLWMLAPPIDDQLLARAIDLPSLNFLFHTKQGVAVYNAILLAEQRYEFLRGTSRLLLSNVMEVQAQLSSIAVDHEEIDLNAAKAAVSIDKRARTEDLLKSAIWGTSSDDVFMTAFASLRDAMYEVFKSDSSIPKSIDPTPGFADSDLPPLPPACTTAVSRRNY